MLQTKQQGEYLSYWYTVWAVLRCLNRYQELTRLIAWAEKKRLSGPRRLYQKRLADQQIKLMRFALYTPHPLRIAKLLYSINRLINKPPRYMAKGAAAAYR
jgi:hypothetical protein